MLPNVSMETQGGNTGCETQEGKKLKMTTDGIAVDPSLRYTERIVCFIDLLGFKGIVEQCTRDEKLLIHLHTMLSELQANKLADAVFGGIPTLNSDRQWTTSEHAGITEAAKSNWPLSITQFSDSFVISCPADNYGSCRLLLQTVYAVNRLFFWHLGVLMRGGIAKGQLIHEQGGVLFGPAMNAAYALESSAAIYPRILINADAAKHLREKLGAGDDPLLPPMFESSDGYVAVDMVSLLRLPQAQPKSIEQFRAQLDAIEADTQTNAPVALPKIRYLQDRFAQSLRRP